MLHEEETTHGEAHRPGEYQRRDARAHSSDDATGADVGRGSCTSAAANDAAACAQSAVPADGDHRAPSAGSDPGDRQLAGRAEGSGAALVGPAQQRRRLTNADIREDANYFSGQASTNIRYIAAGGLAGAWALSKGDLAAFRDPWLSAALVLFVVAMGADLLHYTRQSSRLGLALQIARKKGCGLDDPADFGGRDPPAAWWFALKLWVTLAGCAVLFVAFVRAVFAAPVAL